MDTDLKGQWVAWAGAHKACLVDPPNRLNCIQLAAFQKDRAHMLAYQAWAQDYYWEQTCHTFHTTWTGQGTIGKAYTHALTTCPDSSNHPLWTAATTIKKMNWDEAPESLNTQDAPHLHCSNSQ
jgi:hypothetical protein